MSNISQTQLANFATFAGLIVIVSQQMGWVLSTDQVTFILASCWSLGWTAYNYYQRWEKGDLKLSGVRK